MGPGGAAGIFEEHPLVKPAKIWLVSAMDSANGRAVERAQAEQAASRLSGEAVRQVYALSSPAAEQTAAILAAPHGLDVRTQDGSSEPGEAASSEELRAAADRARDILETIARRTSGRTAVVVTSRAVIQMVLCDMLGMPLDSRERIGQEPCAANLLIRQDYGWVIESVNDDCRVTEPAQAAG